MYVVHRGARTIRIRPGVSDIAFTGRYGSFNRAGNSYRYSASIHQIGCCWQYNICIAGDRFTGWCRSSKRWKIYRNGVDIIKGVTGTVRIGPGVGHIALTGWRSAFHRVCWDQYITANILDTRWSGQYDIIIAGHRFIGWSRWRKWNNINGDRMNIVSRVTRTVRIGPGINYLTFTGWYNAFRWSGWRQIITAGILYHWWSRHDDIIVAIYHSSSRRGCGKRRSINSYGVYVIYCIACAIGIRPGISYLSFTNYHRIFYRAGNGHIRSTRILHHRRRW